MMYFEPFDKSTFEDFLREANTKPDYNTNAGSYYKDLARKNHLIELLSKRIWDYDIELAKRFEEWAKNLEDFPEDIKVLLAQWVQDGTFGNILNQELLDNKADIITSETEPVFVTDKTYWFEIRDTIDITYPTIGTGIGYDVIGG